MKNKNHKNNMYSITLTKREDGNFLAVNAETNMEFATGRSAVEATGILILLMQNSVKVNGVDFTPTPDENELEEDLSKVVLLGDSDSLLY
jgi:hypothetical protein